MIAALGLGLVVLVFIGVAVANTQQQVQKLQPTPTPVAMTGAFNVIVAEFGEEDASGQVQSTERSRTLTRTVLDTLQAQKESFPMPPRVLRSICATVIRLRPAAWFIDETTAQEAARRHRRA